MIRYEKLPQNIITRITEARKIVEEEQAIVFAYLFGGLATGDPDPLSDVDIAVYVNKENNVSEFKLDLFDRITQALGTAELDLIILNTAPLSLAGRIIQNKQILVDKEPALRYQYESVTLREFFDFRIKEALLFQRRYGVGG